MDLENGRKDLERQIQQIHGDTTVLTDSNDSLAELAQAIEVLCQGVSWIFND